MIRKLVQRPLLSAAVLVAVGLSGGGYSVASSGATPAPQMQALTADAEKTVAAQSAAAEVDAQHQRAAADAAAAEHQARVQAERLAAQQAAEAAAQAAAAAAQAEAARQAEAVRQAEAERVSRDAARDPRSAARLLLAEHGWGDDQFSCLNSLWTKESNWSHTADNPTSSAYGIPQALPGSKMASAGADWKTNPVTQMRWGLEYIEGSYGTPCAAWAHSRSNNWY